jgi:hypothetical protein
MLVQLTNCWFAGSETCTMVAFYSIDRETSSGRHSSVVQALYTTTSSNIIFVRVKPNTPYKLRGFHQRLVHLFE